MPETMTITENEIPNADPQTPESFQLTKIFEQFGSVASVIGTDIIPLQRGLLPSATYGYYTVDQLATYIRGSTTVAWGQITGTLSNQTDLQTALNAKASLAGATFTGLVNLPAGQVVNGVMLSTGAGTGVFLRGDGTYAATPSSGTVTSVSVVTANGISGTVATATTTPAITLVLGAINPASVNALTLAAQTAGFTIAGGTTPHTLTVPLDATVSGINSGDISLGTPSGLSLTGQVLSLALATALAFGAVKVDGTTITASAGIISAVTQPGTPGGSNGQVQYNNAGAFGGFFVGGDGTLNASTGVLVVTKTAGVSFAASATIDTTTTANITDSTNKRFVTNAQLVVIGNTSGTNSGDVTIGTAHGLSLVGQAISLALADTSTTGALSSTDWNTFSNKQNAITLTTTGSSGPATLIGSTLNIPQYTAGGGGTVSSVAMTGDGVIFDSTVSGSPITTSGTLAPALLTQTAATFLAGPTTGAAAAPTFRLLVATDVPTLNQNTTGSAAKWTTARNLAGNSVDGSANVAFANKFIVQGTVDAGLSAAQFLGALGTGIIKNTTTTGILSIAIAADFPTLNQNTTGNAATATALLNARTIGGVSFDGTANITVATATGGFTISGGNLVLGANSLTMTGSIGATGARVTKGWFTDLQVTNAIVGDITGNAATVTNATLTTALTINTGTVTIHGNAANTSALTLGAGASSVSGANTGDVTIGTANGLSLSGQALSLGLAATAATGALSSTDWNTFNGKLSPFGSQTANFFYAAPDGSAGSPTFRAIVAADIPTLNQNTTGSAAKWTTARLLAGNSVDGSTNATFANKFIVQGTADSGLSAAQFLGALATGLVKNTTTTGILSIAAAGTDYSAGTGGLATGILKSTTTTGALTIAVAADFPTLNQNTTGSAATLTTPRAINGVNFDGSAAITVTAAAGTLTGTTLNATVVTSSLTTVGTIGTGVWAGTNVAISHGGTGQATANDALNALLPSQTGNNGKFLTTDGTNTSWGSPAGAGTVTNVATDATLTGGPITSTGTLGLNLANANEWTAAQTFDVNCLILKGSTSGTTKLNATAVAGTTTLTLPAATDTLVGKATTDTLTNKTYDTAGSGNSFLINGTAITAVTGTGSAVLATSPTLVTPLLGTPTSGVLTNCTGYTVGNISGLAAGVATFLATPSSANLIAAVTDETGSGALVFGTTPTIATPVINGLATGTGVASAATASTLMSRDSSANTTINNLIEGYTTTATAAGTTTLTVASTYQQFFTGSSTQTVKLPVVSTLVLGFDFQIVNTSTGAVTVQSSGSNTILILAAGTSAWFTCILTTGTTAASWGYAYLGDAVASGKVLTVSNSLTLAGTDGTTMTFPGSSGTVVTLDAAQTLTSKTLTTPIISSISNTGTLTLPTATDTLVARATTDTLSNKRITRRVVTTTQSATPTINTDNTDVAAITGLAQAITSFTTNLSGTPVAGDLLLIQITDNGTARAITWGTSFAATTVTLPTTTVISTMLRVGFQWNTATSKWDCIAVA